jgi:outer membrane protein assembly factor BamE (lipoprotein component of BamABCDE complex)
MNACPSSRSSVRLPGFGIRAITLALVTGLFAGCAQPGAMTTGPFATTDRIDAELKRGVSTKSDVERILGKPNGKGGALMPPTQTKHGEVWTYYNSQTGTPRLSTGRTGGAVKVDVDSRDQMIVVFFDGDKFDGYLWFLQTTTAAGRTR